MNQLHNAFDEKTIDTLYFITTPEGLSFSLKPAGFLTRSLAWAFDLMLQGFLFLFISYFYLLFFINGSGTWITLLLLFVLQWLYATLFEAYNKGRTPGKMVMGIQVVHDDGTDLDIGSSFLRNLLRFIDMPFFSFIICYIVLFFTDGKKRLGDLIAGTMVIYENKNKKNKLIKKNTYDKIIPEQPPRNLTEEEHKAIISFSQRIHNFSNSRATELSKIALSALYSEEFKDTTKKLLSIAEWISGERNLPKHKEVIND